jgi:hypothetical protein
LIPAPRIRTIDLRIRVLILLQKFFSNYFLKVHLHQSSQQKSLKKSQNSRNRCFFLPFLLVEGRIRVRIRTNNDRFGSGSPRNGTDPATQHWFKTHFFFRDFSFSHVTEAKAQQEAQAAAVKGTVNSSLCFLLSISYRNRRNVVVLNKCRIYVSF